MRCFPTRRIFKFSDELYIITLITTLIFIYIYFSLEKEFQEDIKHRFQRKKNSAEDINDVYDGHLYSKLFEGNGPLSRLENFSLKFNTDGVSVFKSSGASVWPVYFQINELPPSKRYLTWLLILIDLSRTPTNNGTESSFDWTKIQQMYENVHPSLTLVLLFVRTELECGKGLYTEYKNYPPA